MFSIHVQAIGTYLELNNTENNKLFTKQNLGKYLTDCIEDVLIKQNLVRRNLKRTKQYSFYKNVLSLKVSQSDPFVTLNRCSVFTLRGAFYSPPLNPHLRPIFRM